MNKMKRKEVKIVVSIVVSIIVGDLLVKRRRRGRFLESKMNE
jgi:hypothetical protein